MERSSKATKPTTRRKTTTRRRPPAAPRTHEGNGAIRDGTIKLDVSGGEYDGKTIEMDVTLVMLACQELEDKHKLADEQGLLRATPAFAKDLDTELKGLGYDSTPAIAIGAWQKAREYFAGTQKKTG